MHKLTKWLKKKKHLHWFRWIHLDLDVRSANWIRSLSKCKNCAIFLLLRSRATQNTTKVVKIERPNSHFRLLLRTKKLRRHHNVNTKKCFITKKKVREKTNFKKKKKTRQTTTKLKMHSHFYRSFMKRGIVLLELWSLSFTYFFFFFRRCCCRFFCASSSWWVFFSLFLFIIKFL